MNTICVDFLLFLRMNLFEVLQARFSEMRGVEKAEYTFNRTPFGSFTTKKGKHLEMWDMK